MEDTRCLAALRAQIALLEGEIVFEGWATKRLGHVARPPGLALLTNWRLIVADINGGFSAVPIAKVDRIDLPSRTTVRLTAWYETISLDFESAVAAATLINCLRQDPQCGASIGQEIDPIALPPRNVAKASADQRLLMAEPSL